MNLQAIQWPRQLFENSAESRVAKARQLLFEEGARPSGLVEERVIQSWMRCLGTKIKSTANVTFNPVSASRMHGTLERNRRLLQASSADLQMMEKALSGTDCRVLLTDASGVIVYATQNSLSKSRLLNTASRVGVNLDEEQMGTTAPAIAAKTGSISVVNGGEHFFECLKSFHCAAAPITDTKGRIVAVLDVTVDADRFCFDAGSFVGLYATSIENRLLQMQSQEQLVMRFQFRPELLGTTLEGMMGVTGDAKVAWINAAGCRLLGLDAAPMSPLSEVLGLCLEDLLRLSGKREPQLLALSNGLTLWTCVDLDAAHRACSADDTPLVGSAAPSPHRSTAKEPSTTPSAGRVCAGTSLSSENRRHIEATLRDAGGNVSRAARILGVSRGLLYRRLAQWADDSQSVASD